MNILITGGSGYIGSVLIQKLFNAKTRYYELTVSERNMSSFRPSKFCMTFDKIVCYDNLMYNQTNIIEHCHKDDFEFVYGDVRDRDKLLPYIKEADVIIPLAAIVGAPACDKNPTAAVEINGNQIGFILDNKRPETKIIYPNTNSGYGIGGEEFCTEESPLEPISLYGKTKCAAEEVVLKNGGVSLRLATVFGVSPRMRRDLLVNDFTYKALRDKSLVLFESHFRRNYISVHDVALTFIHSIINYNKMSGEAYNVGLSSANLTKMQLAEKIKERIPELMIIEHEFAQDLDKRDYIVSNEKLEALNWRPRYKLEDGIDSLIHAYSAILPLDNAFTNL